MKDFNYFQDKYPTIFPSYPRCGFDLPEGWEQLLEDLCDKLYKLDNRPICVQVKEKFGGLRFYTDGATEEADRLISEAESRSYKICQLCSSEKDVKNRGGGWVVNLCSECSKKLPRD